MTLGVGAFDSNVIAGDSGVFPFRFTVEVGTSSTEVVPAKEGRVFLIRHMAFSNTTGGAITLDFTEDGATTIADGISVAANSYAASDGFTGDMLGGSLECVASATGVVLHGWGLYIESARSWRL